MNPWWLHWRAARQQHFVLRDIDHQIEQLQADINQAGARIGELLRQRQALADKLREQEVA